MCVLLHITRDIRVSSDKELCRQRCAHRKLLVRINLHGSKQDTASELPLLSTKIGTIAGIISLTFCFQPEAIRVSDSSESSDQAEKIILNSYTLSGVILTLCAALGGFGFTSYVSSQPTQIRMTTADTYIDSTSLERLLASINTCVQLLPIVPVYSLTASSYIARLLTDWNNTGRETIVTKTVARIGAVLGVTTMTWIYYVSRPMAYQTLGIVGGFIGFGYIYLLPILLNSATHDPDSLQSIDQDFQSIKRETDTGQPNKSLQKKKTSISAFKVMLMMLLGVANTLLPVGAILGFLGQSN